MFGLSSGELFFIAIVALIVLGPERLPKAARFIGLWVRRARAQWYSVKDELERELAAEELKRNLDSARASVRDMEAQLREQGTAVQREFEHVRDEVQQVRDEVASVAESKTGSETASETASEAGSAALTAEAVAAVDPAIPPAHVAVPEPEPEPVSVPQPGGSAAQGALPPTAAPASAPQKPDVQRG